VVRVHRGVNQLLRFQRAAGPVVPLAPFGVHHAEKRFHQITQPELLETEQLSGNVSVKDVAEGKAVIAVEAEHVIARGVKDLFHGGIRQDWAERSQVTHRQRVEYKRFRISGNLDQADFLEVVIQAVCFNVDGEAEGSVEHCEHGIEIRGSGNPLKWRGGHGFRLRHRIHI
jgi:hypothetical protein